MGPAFPAKFGSRGKIQLRTVGVVRPNGTVEIRKIVINRDLGSTLEIPQGLSESEQIIASPPAGLVDGTIVIIAKPKWTLARAD